MIGKLAKSNNGSSGSALTSRFVMVSFLLLFLLTPSLLAQTNVDFFCNLAAATMCTGTVVSSGSNFSSTGINVYNDSGPYTTAAPFLLAFNTATGAVSLDGTGIYAGQNLLGNMWSFNKVSSGATIDYSFTIYWPTIPPIVQAQLHSLIGVDSAFVIALQTGGAGQSVDVLITPTPEPATLFIFGTGLLTIGLVIRKRSAGKSIPSNSSA